MNKMADDVMPALAIREVFDEATYLSLASAKWLLLTF